jgi:hypothetical protein
LLFLAACSGKKTCYIQHAPVTHHFPPLNYDLAILYDRASAAAYASSAARSCGNARPSIEFLPPFSDGYKRPNVGEPPYTVGICLSFLPDVEALGALIDELASSRFVKGVVLRAHPRCTLDLSKLARAGFAFFQPKSRSAEDFFANVDVVLVPNSGVTIAALHFGCPTYFTPGLDSLPEDYYGFVAQGILPVYRPEIFADCDALLSFFDDGWLSRFSDLDETVNTPVATAQKNVELAFLKLLA